MADRGRKNVLGIVGLTVMVFTVNGCQKSSGMPLDQVHTVVSDETAGIGYYLKTRDMVSKDIGLEEDSDLKDISLSSEEISLAAEDKTDMSVDVIPQQAEADTFIYSRDETVTSTNETTYVSENHTSCTGEEENSESTFICPDNLGEKDNDTSLELKEEENTESVPSAYYVQEYAQQVLDMVNARRGEAGLAPLVMNDAMVSAARIRALEIVQSFSHTRPNGTSCFTVLDESGVGYLGAGENLAAGQWSPESAMNSWMNSEGHRDNILNGSFNQIGIACYYDEGSPYGYYWVQCFIH